MGEVEVPPAPGQPCRQKRLLSYLGSKAHALPSKTSSPQSRTLTSCMNLIVSGLHPRLQAVAKSGHFFLRNRTSPTREPGFSSRLLCHTHTFLKFHPFMHTFGLLPHVNTPSEAYFCWQPFLAETRWSPSTPITTIWPVVEAS